MNNKTILANLIEWSKKYGFSHTRNHATMTVKAKDVDNKTVSWFSYNQEKDTYSIKGNTDHLNIWLYETRKDLADVVLYEAIKELATIFEADTKDLFRSLVDPEDWQQIANIDDARADCRYYEEKEKDCYIAE